MAISTFYIHHKNDHAEHTRGLPQQRQSKQKQTSNHTSTRRHFCYAWSYVPRGHPRAALSIDFPATYRLVLLLNHCQFFVIHYWKYFAPVFELVCKTSWKVSLIFHQQTPMCFVLNNTVQYNEQEDGTTLHSRNVERLNGEHSTPHNHPYSANTVTKHSMVSLLLLPRHVKEWKQREYAISN